MDHLTGEEWTELSADIPSVLIGYSESQTNTAALLAPGRRPLSFGELRTQLDYVRDLFSQLGLSRGDPLAVILPKGPEAAAVIAVLPISATVVPLSNNLPMADYERLFQRCGVHGVVLPEGEEHAARLAAKNIGLMEIDLSANPAAAAGRFELTLIPNGNLPRTGRSLSPDVAIIMSTSGTTAEPKLIPFSHKHMVAAAKEAKRWYGLKSTDLTIHLSPLHFAQGIKASLMSPLLSGTSIVCPRRYQAQEFFRQLDEFRPTWLSTGFTIYRDILNNIDDHKDVVAATCLRFMRASSGRLEPAEIRRLERAFNAPVIVGLSSTEAGWIAVNPLPPKKRRIGSVGVPTSNEVRIRRESGQFNSAGEEGEIVVRGPLVFDGYLDDPAATAVAFEDGWYRTGDLGKLDKDGFLHLTGRIKDVINRGGEKISPAEIEDVLKRHPQIAEAASFGWPHATLGEVVVACVVLAPDPTINAADVMAHAQSHLSNAKAPARIFLVNSLPRADNGKLRRRQLRASLVPGQPV